MSDEARPSASIVIATYNRSGHVRTGLGDFAHQTITLVRVIVAEKTMRHGVAGGRR